MSGREVHLERLIGVTVRDRDGMSAGKIEEIAVAQHGDAWFVETYLTGPVHGLSRLTELQVGLWLLGLLGAAKLPGGYRIRWDQLDMTDPTRPRLTCAISDLERVSRPAAQPKR